MPEELIQALRLTIQELNTLSVVVEDIQPTSQSSVVFDKLNVYIKSLEQIDGLKSHFRLTF